MAYCVVPGCISNVNECKDVTFHRLPRAFLAQVRWVVALGLGPLSSSSYVCSCHFEAKMFTKHGKLLQNAVPNRTLNIPPNTRNKLILNTLSFDEEDLGVEVIACRVCLAVDGRLHPISGSGFEDALAALTGIALPSEENVPHHLCAFCLAKLSKYAAFHEGCQRSTELLETLLEKGPLTMDVIKAHSKNSQEELNNLTLNRVFQFGTAPVLEIKPLFNTDNVCSQGETEYTEIEYLESEDFIDNNRMEVENLSFETETPKIKNIAENSKCSKVAEFENFDSRPEKYDSIENEVENCANVDMVTPENTPLKTEIDLDFEKKFNFEITILSRKEQRQMIEERKRKSTADYSCDLCGKEYVKECSLIKHKEYYHDPNLPVECDVCQYRFRRRYSLRKHEVQHRAVYSCRECGNVYRTRASAKDHYLMHQGNIYECPYCQKKYNRQCSYYAHVQLQHPDKNEPCDECGETFTGAMGLAVHKLKQHRSNDKLNAFKCKACDVTFLNAEALKKHEEVGAGVPHVALWPCAACGDSTGSEVALAAHAAEQHPPDQLYCKECDKTFSNASSFALHDERKHKNRPRRLKYYRNVRDQVKRVPVKRIVCEICGKLFMSLHQLESHRNGHLGIQPFQCAQCPKAFTNKFKLGMHMRVHTGEKPYQCEQCPMAFAARGNFTRHVINVHQRVQVECKLCRKTMGVSSLPPHIRAVHMNQPQVRRKRTRTKKPAPTEP